jgi:hypothetical protein
VQLNVHLQKEIYLIQVVKGKEDQVTVAPEKEITVIAKKGSKEPYKIGTFCFSKLLNPYSINSRDSVKRSSIDFVLIITEIRRTSRELIEYGFNNFEKQKLKVNKNNTISVVKGKED